MENNSITNVLIVGVGGQGIILASEILASVCIASGCDVKQSEVHGMAQRGGSVTSHVRFGREVFSPTIEEGCADYLLAFEMLEALRFIDYLKTDGVVFVNRQQIDPITVASGVSEYPQDILFLLKDCSKNVLEIDGLNIAVNAGHIRAVNVALLGALSTYLGFDENTWEENIKKHVPVKSYDINLKAFYEGRKSV
ncbi:indolepyruvate oxidoreductase subunit beta [bacterium]|nr:indolepyruvate oxidoreductase subunit beta [bacterium]